MKEILLYDYVYSYSASQFITDLEKVKNDDIQIRICTDGGDPEYMWGMVAKIKERSKKTIGKVDAKAHSAGLYACCLMDNVECLNVSTFILHRAAYGAWIENDPDLFTEARKDFLTTLNEQLRAAFESKVDVKKFEKLKGVKLDDVFSLETRIDVRINAEEAKEIGLVDKIIDLTPTKKKELNAIYTNLGLAAHYTETETTEIPEAKNKIMTAAEFKAANPAAYDEILKIGASAEKDRVESWMAFNDIDAAAVKAGIESGLDISKKQQSEFFVKAMSANTLADKKDANAPDIATPETPATPATAEEKNTADFIANCMKDLKIK